jgi:hypothetical protein
MHPQLGGMPGDVRREIGDPDLFGEALDDLDRRSGPTRISA